MIVILGRDMRFAARYDSALKEKCFHHFMPGRATNFRERTRPAWSHGLFYRALNGPRQNWFCISSLDGESADQPAIANLPVEGGGRFRPVAGRRTEIKRNIRSIGAAGSHIAV
jgi:hypothetical protein